MFLAVLRGAVSLIAHPASADPAATPSSGSTFVPVGPCRLLDERSGLGVDVISETTLRVQVTRRCGVPTDATASALTLTVTDVNGSGFVSVVPSGSDGGGVSNVNVTNGSTVANGVVVQLSADGAVDVVQAVDAKIVLDVSAAFVDAPAEVRGGRFVPLEPQRLLDTRRSASGRSGDTITVGLPAGVPADASGLVVSVAAVDSSGPGFLTVYGAGGSRPDASVVNVDVTNGSRATTVFAPVSPGGLSVFRSVDTDVLVDAVGWFTGPSTPPSADGLFHPLPPARVWDSRRSGDPVHAGGRVDKVWWPDASAVVANVTVLDATRPGFVSLVPAGSPLVEVSAVNYRWRDPVASLAVAAQSPSGVSTFAYTGVHAIVDVAGYFSGSPVADRGVRASNRMPSDGGNVLFVSDSSLAGIRWTGSLRLLQGASFDARLESCRRLIWTSCRGREGHTPPTALTEVQSLPFGTVDVLVIATGYNDPGSVFTSAFVQIVGAARARGVSRVVWLTYRDEVTYRSPTHLSEAATFAEANRTLRTFAASGMFPELVLADWDSYSAGMPEWVTADGVHVTEMGAREAATYVSNKLAFLDRRPCPATGSVTSGGWCADPDVVGR